MNSEFLRAIVDTLLPGETASAGPSALPSGTAAGVDPGRHGEASQSVFDAIARAAGGAAEFARADEARRVAILQSVQRDMPEAFARLLAALLPDYYEAPAVLQALGWRAEPPQPRGHAIPAMDEATRARLERVRLGRKRWREEA